MRNPLGSGASRKRALVALVAVPILLAFGLGAALGAIAEANAWSAIVLLAAGLVVVIVAALAGRALLDAAQSVRRRHVTAWIPDTLRPLAVEVSDSEPRRVDLIHPAVDLKHFFGGFIGIFNIARRLAERGHTVRLIATESSDLPADWRQRIAGYEGLGEGLDRIEIVFAADRPPIRFHPDDALIATHWSVAHIAHRACADLRDQGFLYLIQEYEPFIFPQGSAAALARASYDLPHRALFSTELLREYFAAHRIGVFADDEEAGRRRSAVFDNAITPVGPVSEEELCREGPPRLLFYARPEEHAQRNLFEVGSMALDLAVASGDLEGWELAGVGAVERGQTSLVLPRSGARVRMVPRTAQAEYAALRRHLDATLFPPPRDPAPREGWAERAAVTAGLLVVGTLLVMLRAGWSASLHTIWAEDGSIFLHGAVTEGGFEKIFAPYANYLVLIPRLIGEAATVVPIEDAPKAISGLSALLVAVSGLVVWHASGSHLRSPWLRGALAVATVLVPVSGLESLDSGAYVSWYMLFATFWVLLWRPATTWGAALAALFVLAAGLSNPGVWFFIPVALLRAVAIRDRRDALIVAGFTLGALVQIPVAASNHEQIYNPTWTSDILTAYLQRVIDGGFFGQELGGHAWAHFGWAFLIVIGMAAIVAFAGGFWRGNRGGRYLAAIALLGSVGIFLVSLYQRAVGAEMIWPGGTFNGSGGRYVIIPALLLLSAAAVLLDTFMRRSDRARWAGWLGVALVGLAVVTSFDMANSEARGAPTWEQSLQGAAQTCLAEPNAETMVEVAPPGVGFNVALPCEQVPSQATR